MPKLPRSTSSATTSMASGTIPSHPAKPHPDRLKIMHLFPDRPLRGSEIGRGLLAAPPVSLNVIGDLLTLREAAHARTLDGADVHEHIPAALVGLNEAIPLLFVEPLYSTGRHCVSFHGRVHERRTPEGAQARLSIIWKG